MLCSPKDRVFIDTLHNISSIVMPRLTSYKGSFSGATPSIVDRLDSCSLHYQIVLNKKIVAGFRLTKIGENKSEAERLFSHFAFEKEAYELGGLWFCEKAKKADQSMTRRLIKEIFHFLKKKEAIFYFKTSLKKGRAARRLGAAPTQEVCWHPHLQYPCHLFVIQKGKNG